MKMDSKQKIKIVSTMLRHYLEDWKSQSDNLNSFYYLAKANLQVYEDYLNGLELDKNETALIKEALQFDKVKFGVYEYIF